DVETIWTDGESISVRVGALRRGATHAEHSLTLIQGFAKGDKCDAIVRDATELGATRIVIAITKRSVVQLDESRTDARHARWVRIALEAARQCGRSDVPLVERPRPWADALESVDRETARFCLYERATEPLAPSLFDALGRGAHLAFACGPEGGLEDAEVEQARALGWSISSLGPRVLRTETVAPAVLGAVRVWTALSR
ncbi:MAG: RsmE family RNA methyltransferase, partial [Polyangiaceae bacterium]